jgi:hypothetical protein
MLRMLLFLVVATIATSGQQNVCTQGHVAYKKPDLTFAKRIKLERVSQPLLDGGNVTRSIQGTRELRELTDAPVRGGSMESSLRIIDVPAQKEILEISISDLDQAPVARWINEKLLFIEIWWGRFVSSDLIVNVETGQVMYHEQASYHDVSRCD